MKRLLFLSVCLMVAMLSFAHDFEVDGIYYNITSSSEPYEVAVTYKGTSVSQYSNEYTGTVTIPMAINYEGKNYSVTSIGYRAFMDCEGLTSVNIPNSVKSIGTEAFINCGLTSVTIPEGVTTIGASAFGSKINSVIVPNSVTSIGRRAFSGTSWFSTYYQNQPDGVIYIGKVAYCAKGNSSTLTIKEGTLGIAEEAFYDHRSVTSVTIPSSLVSIDQNAFYGLTSLQKVIIKDIASWCRVKIAGRYSTNPLSGAGRLYSDEDTEITNLVIPEGVTTINNYVFQKCSSLNSVSIPNSVTNISIEAFGNCSNLKSVTINNRDIISKNYSSSSENLSRIFGGQVTSYILPNDLTSIGSYAFSGCSSLNSITIPNSVTSIGSYAFKYCI